MGVLEELDIGEGRDTVMSDISSEVSCKGKEKHETVLLELSFQLERNKTAWEEVLTVNVVVPTHQRQCLTSRKYLLGLTQWL